MRRKPTGLGVGQTCEAARNGKRGCFLPCTELYTVLFCTFLLHLILDYATITLERNMKGVYIHMEKIARKIFQPNRLTNMLLDGVCDKDKTNLSHFINKAIEAYYTPLNAQLEY